MGDIQRYGGLQPPEISSFTLFKENGARDLSMTDVGWVTFVLKLLLVPTFIALVSLAGRRWGTTVSGWLIGLPLTSGPVAFFLALEQGDLFAHMASEAIMFGIVSVFFFCFVYGRLALRFSWYQSMLARITAFFVSTFLLDLMPLPLFVEFALAVFVLVVVSLLMPHVGSDTVLSRRTRWELPARMLSATALVIMITGFAPLLGPQLTGLLSPFPIYATTLAVFTHRSQGGEEAVKLLRGLVVGSFTFITFFLILSSTILTCGMTLSFLMAIGVSLLTHIVSLQVLKGVSNEFPFM